MKDIAPILAQNAQQFAQLMKSLLPLIPPVTQLALLILELAMKALGPLLDMMMRVSGFEAVLVAAIVGIITAGVKWIDNVNNIKQVFSDLWNWLWTDFNEKIFGFFTKTLPGYWDTASNFLNTKFVQPVENALGGAWNWLVAHIGAPFNAFFTQTLPGYWDSSISFLKSHFVTPFQNALSGAWTWVVSHVWDPLKTFITSTLPGYFTTAVTAIGNAWGAVENAVKNPINWVLQHVIDPLFGAIDDVTNFVGLGKPLPTSLKLAEGGKITGGTPGRDSVLGVLMPGEVVVPTKLVDAGAVDHLRGKLPGFASGGMVNPVGAGLRPERIDMGVDYGGSGPLYAISHGTITNLYNSGWPGGTFIGLRMDQGSDAGKYWYYAEDIAPLTQIGATVNAGQHIANATGGSSGIEIGFAAPPGSGMTMAAATGQQSKSGDPGEVSTGWGKAASDLIASLGGPPGILQGSGKGGTPGISGGFAGVVKTVEQVFAGLGNCPPPPSTSRTGTPQGRPKPCWPP